MSNKETSNKDFTLTNETGKIIKEVWVDPSNAEDWSENRLTKKGGLKHGQSFEFIFEPGGAHKYHISIIFDGGNEAKIENVYLRDISTMTLTIESGQIISKTIK